MDSKRQLLDVLVTYYEQEDRPLDIDLLTDRLDADPDVVHEQLEALRSYELVKRSQDDSGYVPTITAYELLELDIDDDKFVILEFPDDEPNRE